MMTFKEMREREDRLMRGSRSQVLAAVRIPRTYIRVLVIRYHSKDEYVSVEDRMIIAGKSRIIASLILNRSDT